HELARRQCGDAPGLFDCPQARAIDGLRTVGTSRRLRSSPSAPRNWPKFGMVNGEGETGSGLPITGALACSRARRLPFRSKSGFLNRNSLQKFFDFSALLPKSRVRKQPSLIPLAFSDGLG